ncbi:S-DNA-T family DNA segregation ATPase FtsK/SpoIIIE [Saccharothrix tamanrassetensis]|uniref:S-DNA-T family DNA segregation ATPase FtsK/SpoIIIE n=1 Tax=Saccharothrix tamanrassetensis TaxID=1051531 RepID=A0A841CL85_9PSEU|nr:FtsK/SpoIIIE domain-containing protein [Saccharothrix tamanrassetensis]MBB5957703.1 S-DNA-T family DNA segregation ATPase FtsK/SpoIIIE [Saccharothrix tamanrassetensis]
MNGGKWVDPAPFEGVRPRVPWWMLLPGRAKWLAALLALVWLAVVLVVRLVLLVVRYPVVTLVPALAAWCWLRFGLSPLVLAVLSLVCALTVWYGLARDSFLRHCWYRVVTEWRRATVYVPRWRTVVRLAELSKDARGREHRPVLRRVRSEGWRDRVRVRMIPAQSPEAWELRREGLAHSFGARSCRVRVLRPRVVELDFVHRDPLLRPLPIPALADSAEVDLRRVTVGRTENGKPWRLRLLGSQVLVVGVPGAGKGSVLWSLVWQLAPAVRAGLVRLVGIDPKGGMELGQCPDAFDRVVYDNGPDAVALLEEIAAEVKERATRYRGIRRLWARSTGEPFTVLVVDELADLIAYQPDKQLRERAARAIQTITSQGRAPGYAVVGLVQDPRKEVVGFRHLFTTRVALRLDEPQQVDMVLGDGVRQRGAAAHEISENTPGVAWVKTDGQREPDRARAFHVTDADLVELGVFLAPATVHDFPTRPDGAGEAAA